MRVLYPGGFDLFHHGHHEALRAARSIASHLTVAVNSDSFMAHYKHPPTWSAADRVEAVIASGFADEVIIWDGPEGQAEQILHHDPDLYIAGVDWLTKDLAAQLDMDSLTWFEEHNISLLFLQRTIGISTTQLRESC